jgi:hypothetical protein
MTNERRNELARQLPENALIRPKQASFMPQYLVKFRVNTKYNGRTTVWLTDKGYMIQDTANKWFSYMSDNYIAVMREQKQIA